jgi:hypothetical protein
MNKLNYFIALVYSAFLVQAATVLLVLSAEMAFSKWVAMHFPRELRAGTFCACDCTWNVSCQSIVRSAQLRKTPAGELLEQLMDIPTHLFSAIIRRMIASEVAAKSLSKHLNGYP